LSAARRIERVVLSDQVYEAVKERIFDQTFAPGEKPVPTGPGLGVIYDWDYIRAHETAREKFTL
jgi:L-alanine-DL-glutamate epimerase-like enolase superfamily enzyme